MSLISKKSSYSLFKWNGTMRFSLLLYIFFHTVFSACISHKPIPKKYYAPTNSLSKKEELRKRNEIVETARKYKGVKYKKAGKTPKGFDCSGFSHYVLTKNDIIVGASSVDQSKQGKLVKIDDLKPGDLIFLGQNKKISHVGIITKNEKNELFMIHASSSRGIIEENIYQSRYWSKKIISGRNILN